MLSLPCDGHKAEAPGLVMPSLRHRTDTIWSSCFSHCLQTVLGCLLTPIVCAGMGLGQASLGLLGLWSVEQRVCGVARQG